MRMKTRRNPALLLMLILTVAALTAVLTGTAGADTVTLPGGIANGSRVWFGAYPYNGANVPLLWRVLSGGTDEALPGTSGTGEALLITEKLPEMILFNPDSEVSGSNIWSGSEAQAWCGTTFPAKLAASAAERNAVKQSTVTETGVFSTSDEVNRIFEYDPLPLSAESFFFLSAKEASVYFTGNSDRIATDMKGHTSRWWLRSPGHQSSQIGILLLDGSYSYQFCDMDFGARPAFNLNLSSVLFSTLVSHSPDTYKLTFAEPEENLNVSVTGEVSASRLLNRITVTVPYAVGGAAAQDGTKVCLLVTDKAYDADGAAVLQYAELGAKGDGAGSVTLTGLNGTWGTNFHVYLVAVNGSGSDQICDTASVPLELHAHEFSYTAGTGANANTITAACLNGGCGLTQGLKITISVPDPIYDGQPKEAALNNDYNPVAFPGTIAIRYQKQKSLTIWQDIDGAPTVPGKYRAVVTAGTATATVSFTVSPSELTITARDQAYPFNGQTQGPDSIFYTDAGDIAKKFVIQGLQGSDTVASLMLNGQAADVGKHRDTLVPGNAVISNESGSADDCYAVTYVPGALVIYPVFDEDTDFTLPAGTETVGAGAFAGDPLITAVEAGNCTFIGSEAFRDCSGLVWIRVPKNCAIDPGAFTGCGTVYVRAPAGGRTEESCRSLPNGAFVPEEQD